MLRTSLSILTADLAGKTELEQAQVDMIVHCVEDHIRPLLAIFRAKNDEEKVKDDLASCAWWILDYNKTTHGCLNKFKMAPYVLHFRQK